MPSNCEPAVPEPGATVAKPHQLSTLQVAAPLVLPPEAQKVWDGAAAGQTPVLGTTLHLFWLTEITLANATRAMVDRQLLIFMKWCLLGEIGSADLLLRGEMGVSNLLVYLLSQIRRDVNTALRVQS
jgi:hypothetical protein